LLVLTTAVIFFSIFEIFTLCSYIVDYVYFLLLEPCYFLTLLHYSGQYFSVKELNVLHKYNSLVRDLLKISLCCNCLRKLVDAENLLEKQGSAPGAQEALVLAVASVVGARGA
jgi:hypothetical protein